MRSALRFISRSSWLGALSVVGLLALLVVVVVAPPLLTDQAVGSNVADASQGMSAAHWLGTDALGRDVLARVLVAMRLSVLLAVAAIVLGAGIGIPLGAATAMLDGKVKAAVVFLINTSVAFPPLLSAIFLSVVLGMGTGSALVAIGLSYVPYFARFSRTLAAEIGQSDYLAAARMLGVSKPRRLTRYILPNIGEPLIVKATMAIGGAVLAFAGLSFLGLGIQPPEFDLGRLLGDGLDYIYVNPAAALGPAAAVVLVGVVFNYSGEYLAGILGRRRAVRVQSTAEDANRPGSSAAVVGEPREPAQPVDHDSVLSVRGLTVTFPGDGGAHRAVDGVDLDVRPGEIVGLVGESGSGKSVTTLALADLLPPDATVAAGRMSLAGRDLAGVRGRDRQELLKRGMSIVFQDPMAYLNPVLRVKRQLVEAGTGEAQALREQALNLMGELQIAGAAQRIDDYPHQFSGGMRQRLMIAMAMMSAPRLLIADEPTTALDVTVQRRILDQLRSLRDTHGTSILLISHDLAVISQICERVVVMYAGKVVEELAAADLSRARHPYTRVLIGASPSMRTPRGRALTTIPVGSGRPEHSCVFVDRCARADALCWERGPSLERHTSQAAVACWHPEDASGGHERTADQPMVEGGV